MTKKNYLPFILLFVFSSNVKSQTVFPSYTDSSHWSVLECIWWSCYTQDYQYSYDTSFCGKNYSKVIFMYGETGYVRSDSIKTYLRITNNCSGKEYLMYDFSKNIGDTVYVGFNLFMGFNKDTSEFIIEAIDTVTYFGVSRKRIKLKFDRHNSGPPYLSSMHWIHNIGSDLHPFYPMMCLLDGCEQRFSLLCFDSATTQLYQDTIFNTCDTTITSINEITSADEIIISPNPFHDNLFIESKHSRINHMEIISTTGKTFQILPVNNENNFTFSDVRLLAGFYILKIYTESGVAIKRMIKL